MDVRSTTVGARLGIRPARGLIYSVLFGMASWGVIFGAAWLARTLLA